jgi:death-on-curing protein
MTEPVWVEKEALLLLHAKSLAWFGGAEGLRDYDEQHDAAELAASYAFGLAQNHAFVDGNKRMAFMAVGLFLGANGWELNTEPVEAIRAVQSLASGEIGEAEFAAWLRLQIKRI